MVQSRSTGGPKALHQARRRRVMKPPDERRREIIDAATELFVRSGFEATSVQAIAERAGMATGTVYLYFPSKESLMSALKEDFETGMLDRFSEVAEVVLAEEDATGEIVGYQDAIERLIDGMVDYSLERRAVAEILSRHVGQSAIGSDGPTLGSALTEMLARVIREGVRLGYIHTTDPEMMAYLLNEACVAGIGHAIVSRDEEMLGRVVQGAKELYVKALAPIEDTEGAEPA